VVVTYPFVLSQAGGE